MQMSEKGLALIRLFEGMDLDLSRFEICVEAMLCGAATTDDQFSAMVSVCSDIGPQKFATSTLLKRHRAWNRIGAANAFLSLGGPKTMRRREAERRLYLSEVE